MKDRWIDLILCWETKKKRLLLVMPLKWPLAAHLFRRWDGRWLAQVVQDAPCPQVMTMRTVERIIIHKKNQISLPMLSTVNDSDFVTNDASSQVTHRKKEQGSAGVFVSRNQDCVQKCSMTTTRLNTKKKTRKPACTEIWSYQVAIYRHLQHGRIRSSSGPKCMANLTIMPASAHKPQISPSCLTGPLSLYKPKLSDALTDQLVKH